MECMGLDCLFVRGGSGTPYDVATVHRDAELSLEIFGNFEIHGRRKVDPRMELWHSVLESTGQPASFN